MSPYALTIDLGKVVGARPRELRLDAELTQADITARTRIHRPIVSRIERGKHDLDVATIDRYARALELDLATVLVCIEPAWIAAGERVRFQLLCGAPQRPLPRARRMHGAAA